MLYKVNGDNGVAHRVLGATFDLKGEYSELEHT